MIVVAAASLAPAAPVGPPVAVPPDLAAVASVTADPSQVGAVVGQVMGPPVSVKLPLPHVHVEVAVVPAAP